TPRGQEAAQLLKEKIVTDLSIGFDPIQFYIDRTSPEPIRHITELRLWEISLVTHGACPPARVTQVHKRALDIDAALADLDRQMNVHRQREVRELQIAHLEALGGIHR